MALDLQLAEQEVAEIYVSTFGRAPDQAGLAYWVGEVMKGNLTIAQVSESFFDQQETQDLYADASDMDFLISIYKNALGQTVDANDDGLKYWLGELEAGAGVTRDGFIKTLINGAKADTGNVLDAQLLENRVNAGLLYAKEVGVNSDLASQIMNDITADATSAEDAMGMIDFYNGWVDQYSTALGADSTLAKEDLWNNINDQTFWTNLENEHTLTFDAPPPINFWEEADSFWAEGITLDTGFDFLRDETKWHDVAKFNDFQGGAYDKVDAATMFAQYSGEASIMYNDLINSDDMNSEIMDNMFGTMDESLYNDIFKDMFGDVDDQYFKRVYSEDGVLKEDAFDNMDPHLFNNMFSDTLTDDGRFEEFFGDFNPEFIAGIYIDNEGKPVGEIPVGFNEGLFPEGFLEGFEGGEFSQDFVSLHFPDGFNGEFPPIDGTFPEGGFVDGEFPTDTTLVEQEHSEEESKDDFFVATAEPVDSTLAPTFNAVDFYIA
ncbi:MAG: hypothetical protein COB17_10640 [Sulfurimonas sp.]|nr:MAG: hypothetical protein COB17_10640 [Sulfurimonas sp.]